MVGLPSAVINSEVKTEATTTYVSVDQQLHVIIRRNQITHVQFAINCTDFCASFTSFRVKIWRCTNIFTKQWKTDHDCLLNVKVTAAQRFIIKLVGISEEDLFRPSNCLNKYYTM